MADGPVQSAGVSRRSILRKFALTAGGGALLAATASGNRVAAQTMLVQTKVAQKSVAYQDKPKGEQRCDNCTQFQQPASCKVVEGSISPEGWCAVYVKKPA